MIVYGKKRWHYDVEDRAIVVCVDKYKLYQDGVHPETVHPILKIRRIGFYRNTQVMADSEHSTFFFKEAIKIMNAEMSLALN